MNQDTNTQARGGLVGAAGLLAYFFPHYQPLIVLAAPVLYSALAFTKPWWPQPKPVLKG